MNSNEVMQWYNSTQRKVGQEINILGDIFIMKYIIKQISNVYIWITFTN